MLKMHTHLPLPLCGSTCTQFLADTKAHQQLPNTPTHFLQVHRMYRGGGGSMQRAQEEWSTGMWKSATAREAGLNAVAQTGQGPSLPQYPTAVPSYPDNSHW